jgi:hypothetical protein
MHAATKKPTGLEDTSHLPIETNEGPATTPYHDQS